MAHVNEYVRAELALSPQGHIYLNSSSQASEQLLAEEFEKINFFFTKGIFTGILHLGIKAFSVPLPASFLFWQTFSKQFVTAVCKLANAEGSSHLPEIPEPSKEILLEIMDGALLMKGLEYLNSDVLLAVWRGLSEALHQELEKFPGNIQAYLQHYNPHWNLIGRVCFHLAENKNNELRPFAFLATYTTQLSQTATIQHLPLKRALQDYAGEKNHAALLTLLLPVQKAASQSLFIKGLVESAAIFQPLTWTAREAHKFLQEIALMESSGIVVRIPNWWNKQKPPRPKVVVKVGEAASSTLGLSSMLDFNIHLALGDGEELTRQELASLLSSEDGLVKIKGQWVEVDQAKLKSVLSNWDNFQNAANNGLSMAESLRLLAGGGSDILADSASSEAEAVKEWSTIIAGDWLQTVLSQLKTPQNTHEKNLQKTLKKHLTATLRPYQLAGVQWLWLLYQLQLGGCLADDMGLGKTIQVLALLLLIKYNSSSEKTFKKPHLLVVPASLLGNWQMEAARFAPSLNVLVAHSSIDGFEASGFTLEQIAWADIVITTYAFIHRLEWLKEREWDLIVLDEAQLIKNADTKQTRAVKALKSQVRLALTGTPVENRLGDLWSLFDFTSPGLLGSSKVFAGYAKKGAKDSSSEAYSRFIVALRALIQPYILRRLKSDKKIIADLPDKTEMQTYCSLSKMQVKLYQQTILELTEQLKSAEGIKRKGLVLSFLMRFKQICNHPDQALGYGDFSEEQSGKFVRLKEICEEICAKQEKVLIFTQFREIIPALAAFLAKIFGREGLVLHGGTDIKKRPDLVKAFQEEQGPPFFVLSLKAGGTGLNLTRASHVIHFDRWWNPAVENQATDRAYRIGQKHPVLVHKFICSGTMEEKIDILISSKKDLSQKLLGDEESREMLLTELSNDELLKMISIDINKAMTV